MPQMNPHHWTKSSVMTFLLMKSSSTFKFCIVKTATKSTCLKNTGWVW